MKNTIAFTVALATTLSAFAAWPCGMPFVTASPRIREINYSGLLTANDVTHLDGLAVENDRLTKLSLWFGSAGITEDVALELQPALDHRDVVYDTTYVNCGPGQMPPDARPNVATVDGGPLVDTGPQAMNPTPTSPSPHAQSGAACSIARGDPGIMVLPLIVGLALLGRRRRRDS